MVPRPGVPLVPLGLPLDSACVRVTVLGCRAAGTGFTDDMDRLWWRRYSYWDNGETLFGAACSVPVAPIAGECAFSWRGTLWIRLSCTAPAGDHQARWQKAE